MIMKSNVESRADAIEGSLQALHDELNSGDWPLYKNARRDEGAQADTDMGARTLPPASAGSRRDGRRAFRASSAEARGGGGGGGSDELRATVVGLPTVVGQKALHSYADALFRSVLASQQVRLRVVCLQVEDKTTPLLFGFPDIPRSSGGAARGPDHDPGEGWCTG